MKSTKSKEILERKLIENHGSNNKEFVKNCLDYISTGNDVKTIKLSDIVSKFDHINPENLLKGERFILIGKFKDFNFYKETVIELIKKFKGKIIGPKSKMDFQNIIKGNILLQHDISQINQIVESNKDIRIFSLIEFFEYLFKMKLKVSENHSNIDGSKISMEEKKTNISINSKKSPKSSFSPSLDKYFNKNIIKKSSHEIMIDNCKEMCISKKEMSPKLDNSEIVAKIKNEKGKSTIINDDYISPKISKEIISDDEPLELDSIDEKNHKKINESQKITKNNKKNNSINHESIKHEPFVPHEANLTKIISSELLLDGLTIVPTGDISSFDRDQFKNFLHKFGARPTGSVSSKTSYVVAGSDPGPSKIEKAQKLGISILSEADLLSMMQSKLLTISKIPQKKKKVLTYINPDQHKKSESPLPWVDKYAPKTLCDVIGQSGPRSNLNKLICWLKNWKPTEGSEGKLSVLLSGPPGIGKTTIAHLAAKELNYDCIELNASDSRSAKLLNARYCETSKTNMLVDNFQKRHEKQRHCIIMDEIDGISGNSDRGGLSEVIKLIKTSANPIICICNDRSNMKIKTLVNYCLDLRFHKPKYDQIKALLLKICFREKLNPSPVCINEIITACNCDIRMAINYLELKSPLLRFGMRDLNTTQKDIFINIFDAVRKLLSSSESTKMKFKELSNLFFTDYSACPLFIFENYLNVNRVSESSRECLKTNFRAAELISLSNCIESTLRNSQDWRLLTPIAFISTIIPSIIVRGHIQSGFDPSTGAYNQGIRFPAWFGKYSTTQKNERLLQKIAFHSKLKGFTSSINISEDIAPFISKMALASDQNGDFMELLPIVKGLYLDREDLDFMISLCSKKKLTTSFKNAIFKSLAKDHQYVLPYINLSKTSSSSKIKKELDDNGFLKIEDEIGQETNYTSEND